MNDQIGVRWYSARPAPGYDVPDWMLAVGLLDDGRMFMPAGLHPDGEAACLLLLAQDGAKAIMDAGHAYVESDWLRGKCPTLAPVIDRVETSIRGLSRPN